MRKFTVIIILLIAAFIFGTAISNAYACGTDEPCDMPNCPMHDQGD